MGPRTQFVNSHDILEEETKPPELPFRQSKGNQILGNSTADLIPSRKLNKIIQVLQLDSRELSLDEQEKALIRFFQLPLIKPELSLPSLLTLRLAFLQYWVTTQMLGGSVQIPKKETIFSCFNSHVCKRTILRAQVECLFDPKAVLRVYLLLVSFLKDCKMRTITVPVLQMRELTPPDDRTY